MHPFARLLALHLIWPQSLVLFGWILEFLVFISLVAFLIHRLTNHIH
jgi:hypothetical protein